MCGLPNLVTLSAAKGTISAYTHPFCTILLSTSFA